MNHSTFFYSGFALLFLVWGCNTEDQPSPELSETDREAWTLHQEKLDQITAYSVRPDQAAEYPISDWLREVRYVALDLPGELILREVRQIHVDESSIYIRDEGLGGGHSRFFSFDRDGQFNYMIDEPGRGPGEYDRVYDFAVTESHLIISTNINFLFFDKQSGEFIRSEELPRNFSVQIFEMLDEQTLVSEAGRTLHNRSRNLVQIYDFEQQELLHQAVPFQNHALKGGHTYRYLFKTGDTLSVIPMYEPVVYRVTGDEGDYSVKPAYSFDFGDFWIDEEFLAGSYDNRDRFFRDQGMYVHTLDIFETEQVIYVHYRLEGRDYIYFHDLQSGRSADISSFTDNRMGWHGTPFTTDGDWIVNLVTPFDVEESGEEPVEELRRILEQIDDEGDPILVFGKFGH